MSPKKSLSDDKKIVNALSREPIVMEFIENTFLSIWKQTPKQSASTEW